MFLLVSDTLSIKAVSASISGIESKFREAKKRLANATPKNIGSILLTTIKVFESRLIVRSSSPNGVNIKRKQIITASGLKIMLMLYRESHVSNATLNPWWIKTCTKAKVTNDPTMEWVTRTLYAVA